MDARFSVGIDLGTSNSAIAIADLETGETRIVDITQILAPNQLGGRPTLASALYVPHGEEFPKGSFPLPWNEVGEAAVVGEFGRDHGALVPGRGEIRARPCRVRPGSSCPPREVLVIQSAYRLETADPALAIRHRGRQAV